MEFSVKQKQAETEICFNFPVITLSELIKLPVRGIEDCKQINILSSLFLHTKFSYFVNGQKKELAEFGFKCS